MSLGWGLRGSIGGGSLGAMIPGAMIGLVLCVLLDRHSDAGLIAAFAAVGVGFGGQETYGQTVGLSLQPETFWWAILGFVIKGAAWGLLGGAFIGIALERQRHTTAHLVAGFAIMVLGTWGGWRFVNSPNMSVMLRGVPSRSRDPVLRV
jgi:RsiW-degrading membrane proteinase PrsW (M82 family)